MTLAVKQLNLRIFFLACRPKFLIASISPVLVGSAFAYAVNGSFQLHLLVLALLGITFLHAGANIVNDYFDHTSKNDWVNQNPTPFSGGSRFIQQKLLSPKATLFAGLTALIAGSVIGLIIVILTQSFFIFALGLIGLFGGYFYTASPLRLGYRCMGEITIFLLFGVLPVYGAYFLQTESFDTLPLLAGSLVGILIFLVILVNEFPDVSADAAVNKRTLVVSFGIPVAVWIYRTTLIASFIIAVLMMAQRLMLLPGLFYMLTLPVAIAAMKAVNKSDLNKSGQYHANQITILLHAIGSLALIIGFIITALRN